MDELKTVIVNMLIQYFDEDVNVAKLGVLTDRAMLAYQEYLNYPDTWDDDEILADMTKHKSCICDLALYEAIQEGTEFQTMHIESGLYRMWQSQGSVFTKHRVVPYVTL